MLGKIKRIIEGAIKSVVGPFDIVASTFNLPAIGAKKLAKKIHRHIAYKPHLALTEHITWYKKWHSNKYHALIHTLILASYVIVIFSALLVMFNRVTFADQQTTTWDFQNLSSYSFDGNLLEQNGTSIELKLPYSTDKPVINLTSAALTSGVVSYVSFQADENTDGGSIMYRLSGDSGATWKYWNGASWTVSSSVNQSNNQSDINDNISTFPVTFGGINWQAIFISDGNQKVALNSVSIAAEIDTDEPEANASNITGKKVAGGDSFSDNNWINGGSPYFSWDSGSDSGSGVPGYCLYLGQDSGADPVTTSGFLQNGPLNTDEKCQFATSSLNLDLATSGIMSKVLASSQDPYYLIIKTIDRAGNVTSGFSIFGLRFDNTPPTNPDYISGPTTYLNSKNATFTWDQTATDADSGILGMQYNINNTVWYGDLHNGNGDISDLLEEDGTYTLDPTYDYPNIHDGINVIYFRTWDNAGNLSTYQISAVLKVNTTGSPSAPQSLTVNPSGASSTNSFAFSWGQPATFYGDARSLEYCYVVNTLPSASTCNYTSPGVTSLAADSYATQPGANTFYVVAKDESGNISYDSYSSITFTANTYSPGIPRNIDISDVSTKVTSNWRLAITWDVPEDVGIGISKYIVYRSTDDLHFSQIGTSSSTTYIDAGLSQQTYHYYVTACDSTNNCSADSQKVSSLPTGKFKEPANLVTGPNVGDITTKKVTVNWATDRNSDSRVFIGTTSGKYSSFEVGSSSQVTAHNVTLDNLAPGTTYYGKASWTDIDSNQDESQEFTFTTKSAPIVRDIKVESLHTSGATVSFTSVGSSKINLYYGETDNLRSVKSINTSISSSQYSLELSGLKDNTKYYYQLSAEDSEGANYGGNIFSFTTPPSPRITNLRFQPVSGESTSTQSVTWTTNVPTTSIITYGIVGAEGVDVQVSKLVTDHQIVINNLEDNQNYFLTAQSRDASGNLAVSDRQVFKTALDTRPPHIEGVTIESTVIGTGSEANGQIVVSWTTDEPSTSQVGYAIGTNNANITNRTSEDKSLTTNHTVVISDLSTSKVYSIWPMSHDLAGNLGSGVMQSAIIGHADDSVLTVILSALQRIFGL